MNLKPFAVLLTIVLVANFFLFALGIISLGVFWGFLIFSAIIAYLLFPRLRAKERQAKR